MGAWPMVDRASSPFEIAGVSGTLGIPAATTSVSDDRGRFPWPCRWRCCSLPLTLILPPSLSLTLFRVGAGDSKARGRLAEDGFDRDGAAAWQGNRDSPIVETSTGKLRREV